MRKEDRNIDLIMDYVRGELSPEENRKVRTMIKKNAEMSGIYRLLKTFLDDFKDEKSAPLSSSLKKLSTRMFRDYHRGKKQDRSFPGLLVYDSRVLPHPEGIRPSVAGTGRLKYKIGPYDLEISIYPVSIHSYEMIGRIGGIKENTACRLELSTLKASFETETDELALFRFPRIPIASYKLRVFIGSRVIAGVEVDL